MQFLPIFLAWRFLFSGSERAYLSVISWFSLIGMALGVAALIIVSSVMNGFERQLQERILSIVPHIFVEPIDSSKLDIDRVRQVDHVVGIAPYRKTQAMISSQGILAGITLNGIEPESLKSVSLIPESVVVGSIDALQDRSYKIVIGAGLARQLGIYVGDKITLILPQVTLSPAGAFPRSKRFTVVGVFQVGADVDETEVYIHLEDMLRLERKSRQNAGFRVQLDDVLAATYVKPILQTTLGDNYHVSDWSSTHGSLFQAVKVEKLMVALLLSIIVFVAAFNVVAVLTMIVINKRAVIAVLLTIGAKTSLILYTFIWQGLLLGAVGTFAGLFIGIPIALFLTDIMTILGVSLFDADVYYITALPSVVKPFHIVLVTVFAIAMSLLATIYPSFRATQVHPSEVLRYE